MKHNFSFSRADFDFYGTAWYDEDGIYDVTDFRTIDLECNEIFLEWEDFEEDILKEINIPVFSKEERAWNYNEDSYMERVYYKI